MNNSLNALPAISPLLSFVAISQVDRGVETLNQIVLQTVACLDTERFSDSKDISKALKAMFGLEIAAERIEPVLNGLLQSGALDRKHDDTLLVAPAKRARIERTVNDARQLEEDVKLRWIELCQKKYPTVNPEQSWGCLKEYLFRLFRRHGMQTVALLDGGVANSEEHLKLLSVNLSEVVRASCEQKDTAQTETAISDFLSSFGTDKQRTAYVVQLADGAFNYYALSAPPELANHLQSKLQELVLFLDTNFLFGVFGLDTNPLVAVSQELIRIVEQQKLPFKLRYHEATDTEMRRTIGAIASAIKSRHWTSELSRAAAESPYVSGIERHFHEENARGSVDPEVFFKPYEHVDVLLKEKGVLIYRASSPRVQERADLCARYSEYLKKRDREKPYEAIDHDMTLLDCVRQLRSTAKSSLEARALIITCDSMLNKFDWYERREDRALPTSILPSHFLQLLRPYVPAGENFDKSFAQTFAIPEFRAISGGYHLAARKLLSLLATYKDLKEETATVLLANTMLLENIQHSSTAQQAQKLVESAIIAANAELLEERVALLKEVKQARSVKANLDAAQSELSTVSQNHNQLVEEHSKVISKYDNEQAKVSELEGRLRESENELSESRKSFSQTEARLGELEKRLGELQTDAADSRASAENAKTALAILSAAMVIFGWEWLIHHFAWGTAVLTHANAYAIRLLTPITVVVLFLGIARPKLRSFFWVTIGLAVVIGLITVLGGPNANR